MKNASCIIVIVVVVVVGMGNGPDGQETIDQVSVEWND